METKTELVLTPRQTPSNNEQVRLTSLREGEGCIFHLSWEPFLKGQKDTYFSLWASFLAFTNPFISLKIFC